MGDAAGKAADAFQFLCLKELLLEPFELRYVLDYAGKASDGAIVAANRFGAAPAALAAALLLSSKKKKGRR